MLCPQLQAAAVLRHFLFHRCAADEGSTTQLICFEFAGASQYVAGKPTALTCHEVKRRNKVPTTLTHVLVLKCLVIYILMNF